VQGKILTRFTSSLDQVVRRPDDLPATTHFKELGGPSISNRSLCLCPVVRRLPFSFSSAKATVGYGRGLVPISTTLTSKAATRAPATAPGTSLDLKGRGLPPYSSAVGLVHAGDERGVSITEKQSSSTSRAGNMNLFDHQWTHKRTW